MTFLTQSREEKTRQKLAVDLIRAIEALEPVAKETMNEQAVKSKRYALPLPFPLRIVQTGSGAKIIPNSEWVKLGFRKD
jgi:hypothetical protein